MARPLSEAKRDAILASAAELVATMGTSAPTAKIAKGAGLAEGTLFKYFTGKDDLLNQLFLEIEADLAAAMMDGYPSSGSPRERVLHVWNRTIEWGAAYPQKRKVLRQLKVSDRITPESKRRGMALFDEIRTMFDESLADGTIRKGASAAFAGSVLDAIAETTLEFIANDPARHDDYKQAGFDAFWSGIGS